MGIVGGIFILFLIVGVGIGVEIVMFIGGIVD